MDNKSKIFRTIMIILFPLGILYCVGRNLFKSDFASFLGGLFLLAGGFVLAIFLLRPDLVEPIISFFGGVK